MLDFSKESTFNVIVGKSPDTYRVVLQVTPVKERLFLKFGFCRAMIDEVKNMKGYSWNPEETVWSVANCGRNHFTLRYLAEGEPTPYLTYKSELIDEPLPPRWSNTKKELVRPYAHQQVMFQFIKTRRHCIIAGEMGTGKTLPTLVAAEQFAHHGILYVAPKSVLKAIEYEIWNWGIKGKIELVTYDGLKKLVKSWVPGVPAPRFIIFDESSSVKTPDSQRSTAAMHFAESVRKDWRNEGYVVLLTGTPAPKSPVDWWNQAEIACPGYLKEQDHWRFKQRLALIEDVPALQGGTFPKLITWRDSELKCEKCGQLESAQVHIPDIFSSNVHKFERGRNEVERLYNRLKGLVMVQFKKDCIDLPEKRYVQIELKPSRTTLQMADLITSRYAKAIRVLTFLRELSDGFQYDLADTEETVPCPQCSGTGVLLDYISDDGEQHSPIPNDFCTKENHGPCEQCGGEGKVFKVERIAKEVSTPKEPALLELLGQHEEVGRLVIYAGFQASIDRCCRIAQSAGWDVLRVDGRGWHWIPRDGRLIGTKEYLKAFQTDFDEFPKLAFIGHPGSAGMGLTLTASPSIVYWSNDFNATNRIQSEDRIHRPGADPNKGCTIYDLMHLPSDYRVLENLKKKRDLQAMSLGELMKGSSDGFSADSTRSD